MGNMVSLSCLHAASYSSRHRRVKNINYKKKFDIIKNVGLSNICYTVLDEIMGGYLLEISIQAVALGSSYNLDNYIF